jgi:glycosyltransferase involved in cell wall biosynthesis
MYEITVITPTIGRHSLLRLVQTLALQKIKVIHIILWDNFRCENALSPDDKTLLSFNNDNYIQYNYVIAHPVYNVCRKDNFLRSVGIMMSGTPYITQIDDDCWIEPDWLLRAVSEIKRLQLDYIFCIRCLWEDEHNILGLDDYESIGIKNKFGYNLMETNSIVFTTKVALPISNITKINDQYGHDRILAEELTNMYKGKYDTCIGLHQIVPDFLIDFHRRNIEQSVKNLIA